VTCSIARELLGAYFDGELDASAELQLRLHLADCEGCAAELQRMQMRRELMRGGGLSYQAPPALEARIRKSLGPRRTSLSSWRPFLAIAAAVLFVSVLSVRLMQMRTQTSDTIAQQAVSSHVRALMTGHTTDIVSTDRHTVKPWFNGRIDFSPPVVDLAGQGFPLLGGRLDYIAGRSVATLVYGRRKHLIDVFIWPSTHDGVGGNISAQGYNVVRWTRGGMSFVAVSDLNKAELDQFVNQLRKE
jgi:anti-sigma factor RsiW